MLASAVIGCAIVSAICFSIELKSSGVGLNNCAITAGIKKYKPIIEKRKRSMIDILLAKPKLNTIEVLISRALIESIVSHDYFF